MNEKIFETKIGELAITLSIDESRFNITYGVEEYSGYTYDEAVVKLGACIMGALWLYEKID